MTSFNSLILNHNRLKWFINCNQYGIGKPAVTRFNGVSLGSQIHSSHFMQWWNIAIASGLQIRAIASAQQINRAADEHQITGGTIILEKALDSLVPLPHSGKTLHKP
ncbi:hypothetical protein AMTRI_Chr13g84120 [Amborella trichopoda]